MKPQKPFFRWRPHPWHGLKVGPNPPRVVNAFIEITPYDTVKYEVDKETGFLRVDRPQRTSSHPPTLYGFIPRTFCGDRVAGLSPLSKRGDGDPMDICIISERPIDHSEIIVESRVIGGIQMIDNGEADDKIVAVLVNDSVWGRAEDLGDIPEPFVERLRHYFSTYKFVIGEKPTVSIETVYGAEHAWRVVEASQADYMETFGEQADPGAENDPDPHR